MGQAARIAIAALAALLLGPLTAETAPAPKPKAAPEPPTTASTPSPADREPDTAFAAFQRGYYITAFAEATRRVDQKSDVKAMTLLGELYADGLGVPRDDLKAAKWYQLAADRGDREAMFALAMFKLVGRAGARDRDAAAKLMTAAAKLGHAASAYNLGLLYLEGQLFPQDFTRAAELFRLAAEAGNSEAQYALATFYKEGRGTPKDLREAARLLGAAALVRNIDAEVEYGIALFNGTGVARNETAAFPYLFKAARKGSPIAQRRLAFMYATGRGATADPVQAARWHLIARAGGDNDQFLDEFVRKMKPADRTAAEEAAKPWLTLLAAAARVKASPFPDPVPMTAPTPAPPARP
jgi:TPR repeat protein